MRQKIWPVTIGLSILLGSTFACREKSKTPAPPKASTSVNSQADACKKVALSLVELTVPAPDSVDSSELTILGMDTSRVTYKTKEGSTTLTRLVFNPSPNASYVRWRACPLSGSGCFPSDNPSDWQVSSFYDDLYPNLPVSELKITAQACTEFPKNAEESCGKPATNLFKLAAAPSTKLTPLYMEVNNTELGIWQETKALEAAARALVGVTDAYLEANPSSRTSEPGIHLSTALAHNYLNLGRSEIWRYLQIHGADFSDTFASLGQGSDSLNLTASKEPDCPDTLAKEATGSSSQSPTDLLSSIFGSGSSQIGEEETATTTGTETATDTEITTTEEAIGGPSPSDGNTNNAAADTPSPSTDPLPTENTPKDKSARTSGGLWIAALGVVGVGGSLAFIIYKNKNSWIADKVNRKFRAEVGSIEANDPDRLKKLNALVKEYKGKMPKGFEIAMEVKVKPNIPGMPPVKQESGKTLDSFEKLSDAEKVKFDFGDSTVRNKGGGTPEGFKGKRAILAAIASTFFIGVGTYMVATPGLAESKVGTAVRVFYQKLADIQESIANLLERRQKALSQIAEAQNSI